MTGVQTCALRSEEHTSELQSHDNLVCRLLLEKKNGERTPTRCRRRPRRATARPGGPAGRRADWPGLAVIAGPPGRPAQGLPLLFFFFSDPAPPEISPLSLPGALPI